MPALVLMVLSGCGQKHPATERADVPESQPNGSLADLTGTWEPEQVKLRPTMQLVFIADRAGYFAFTTDRTNQWTPVKQTLKKTVNKTMSADEFDAQFDAATVILHTKMPFTLRDLGGDEVAFEFGEPEAVQSISDSFKRYYEAKAGEELSKNLQSLLDLDARSQAAGLLKTMRKDMARVQYRIEPDKVTFLNHTEPAHPQRSIYLRRK